MGKEICFKAGSHKDAPLDCLTCNRPRDMPYEMSYDYHTLDGAFISGKRMTLFELIMAFTKHAPLTPEQENVLKAVGTRSLCAYDRGETYEDQIPFLKKITEDIVHKFERS